MSDDNGYTTLEEFIESNQSPYLQPSRPNFESCDTPPPLVDISETSDQSDSEANGEGDLLASKGSKGPSYPPEIAIRAGIELVTDSPESPCEDYQPQNADEPLPMIAVELSHDGPRTSSQSYPEQALQASKKATEALNAAIGNRCQTALPLSPLPTRDQKMPIIEEVTEIIEGSETSSDHDKQQDCDSVTERSHSPQQENSSVAVSQKPLNVKPPPKPGLPQIQTDSTSRQPSPPNEGDDSIARSPTLAKFAIHEGHPSQTLAKIQSHSPPNSSSASSPEPRQQLPSLETALNSATDSNGTPYPDPSPSLSAITRPSPSTYSHMGPSPTTFSQSSSISAMSPPRLSSNPSLWRTTSHNSAVSTPSADYASANATTPASSHSMLAPTGIPFEANAHADSETQLLASASGQMRPNDSNGISEQGYKCPWPDCTAPPFQTQYLLNSHTNVHSNTRSHFCPVKGCPRGPGGQGFKRKNEMIRHGLVHQSPGYVCPFCPDQQHKYPRPDNLQRHVRVHHPDRDRDDPQLREVLAQRPEGGNRGRRRRLGS